MQRLRLDIERVLLDDILEDILGLIKATAGLVQQTQAQLSCKHEQYKT